MVAWSNVQVIHIRACDLFNLLELPPGLKVTQSGNFPRIFFITSPSSERGLYCVSSNGFSVLERNSTGQVGFPQHNISKKIIL